MLWTIAGVLAALWLLGIVTSYTMGGLIYLLLVMAAVVVLLRFMSRRGPFLASPSLTRGTTSQTTFLLSLAALVLGAGASSPINSEKLASSELSVRGAEEVGASGVPAAKLHLQLARDESTEAKKLAAGGDPRSEALFARSEADAELALGLAREATMHNEALKATEDLNAVKSKGAP